MRCPNKIRQRILSKPNRCFRSQKFGVTIPIGTFCRKKDNTRYKSRGNQSIMDARSRRKSIASVSLVESFVGTRDFSSFTSPSQVRHHALYSGTL